MNKRLSAGNEYKNIVKSLDKATLRPNGRRDFSEVSDATNLTSAWLSCFTKGEIGDAGFHRVRAVQDWLIGKQLLIADDNHSADEAA